MSSMASAEASSAGPRYAPEDPTLPKPWLGLIDGSTGYLYYWNPESNVTQYEKPTGVPPPPLPPGPPPPPVLPQLQPSGSVPPQSTQQQGQEPQQYGQLMPQQQGLPSNQQLSQPGHLRPQMMQQPVQQMFPHMGQQQQQQQALQQHQTLQMPLQGQQHSYQQYMTYQQNKLPPNQKNSQQQFPNQHDYNTAFPKRGDMDFQQGNQSNFSPPHFQQPGVPSSQHLPTGGIPTATSQAGAQPSTMTHLQQSGPDLVHQQHGPRFQNHVSPSMMHNQQSNIANIHGRTGNDYHFSAKMEGPPILGPGHPNLTAMPMGRNQQDLRMGDMPFQNVSPGYAGGFNSAGHTMNNIYNNAAVRTPFPNNAIMRPPIVGGSDVTNLSPAEAYRQEHEVTATGDDVPAPFITFEATGFPPEILNDIRDAGFLAPTPIQAQTWPIALRSRDIVAIAKTGSGKTLGYLIPAFILLRHCRNNPQNGPTVLVLAPTRELATQIQAEVIKFGRSSRVSCTCLYGGAPKGPQLNELDRGADIVVATPGRLNDILEMKKIDFGQVSLLVLDEADRMLDMGFEPQIRKIVNEIPPRRQTLMYTATWPKEVRKIASDLLVNPVQVNIGSVDELEANKAITQYVEVVPQMEKESRLQQILRAQERGSKIIIFCSTKRLCDQLARGIGRQFGAAVIHGDKSQGERDWVLSQFRSGKSPILVATDVAARGLDIKDIRVVINYDFPTGIEDYVHRIGRTGRAGATGVSYTFFSEQDWKYAPDLIKVLEGANQLVPPEVREMALHGGPGLGKDRGRMSRFESGGGRWESVGRGGMRDGGFGGRGGMRDGSFGGRGGMRDGNLVGHGGIRDGGFGGRGGMRDGSFGGRGGRNDSFSGRGNRGRGFGGHVGWGRTERGSHDRYKIDGRGRGRGRGRFDGRRETLDRGRDRSYSRSPDRVRTWGYSRSRSRSRSRSSSRSRSWSRGRSRSYSRSPHRSRSYSRSPHRSHSHSRSRSYERFDRPRQTRFDEKDVTVPEFQAPVTAPEFQEPEPGMSPMSPGTGGNSYSGAEMPPKVESAVAEGMHPEASQAPPVQSVLET